MTSERLEPIIKSVHLFLNESVQDLSIQGSSVEGEDRLLSVYEKNRTINNFNLMFDKVLREGVIYSYKNKPTNLQLSDLTHPENLALTIKYDGVRFFLFIDGNGGCYLLDNPFVVIKLNVNLPFHPNTIIDGEVLIENNSLSYYAFDILFHKSKNIQSDDLIERLRVLNDICYSNNDIISGGMVELSPYFKMSVKKFFTEQPSRKPEIIVKYLEDGNLDSNLLEQEQKRLTDIREIPADGFYIRANDAMEEYDNLNFDEEFPVDGLILQPIGMSYKNSSTRKWKPNELMTIDFLLKKSAKGKGWFKLMVGGDEGRLWLFQGDRENKFDGEVFVEGGKFKDIPLHNQIVEMVWKDSSFKPHRFRFDKNRPNYTDVAVSVWRDIHRPIDEETLLGDTLKVMRRYHNSVKMSLLSTLFRRGEVILDIGSGRGGDLMKWKKRGLKVIGIEPEQDNVDEFMARSKKFGISSDDVLLYHGSAQDTQKIVNVVEGFGSGKVDGVVAFFSLTFFNGSKNQLNQLINTVDSVLSEHGIFVGIVMDGERVKGNMEDGKIDTEAFSLSKRGDWSKKTPYGKVLNVNIKDPDSMVNYDEFLFMYSNFSKQMRDRKFTQVKSYFLDGIKKIKEPVLNPDGSVKTNFHGKPIKATIEQNLNGFMPKDSQLFSSMNRVFIFERKKSKVYGKLAPLKIDEIETNFRSPYPFKLNRIGVDGTGSCFFSAIIRAFSKKYANMNLSDKREYVKRLRLNLSNRLTVEEFKKLANGNLAEVKIDQNLDKVNGNRDLALRLGWAQYAKGMADCSVWVGEEMLQYISDQLGVDVYVLHDTTRDVYKMGADCNVLYKNRPSVVLIYVNESHYETVGRQGVDKDGNDITRTLFRPDDPFIKQLRDKACN